MLVRGKKGGGGLAYNIACHVSSAVVIFHLLHRRQNWGGGGGHEEELIFGKNKSHTDIQIFQNSDINSPYF